MYIYVYVYICVLYIYIYILYIVYKMYIYYIHMYVYLSYIIYVCIYSILRNLCGRKICAIAVAIVPPFALIQIQFTYARGTTQDLIHFFDFLA